MRIFIKARPNSKKDMVKKIGESNFIVSVTEPPIDGRANEAIAKALARHFGIISSRVSLVSGFSSKQKVFEIG
ncbi:MAG: hypothetical protein A3C07_01005 [Candidatus Sungbacteria bacterium RIFCSPHIGHO2_02_FULL_47_11]|uniref:Uncharacterized protein n=1 Tax=Candidatus Sungbacteria bacterium RIFCSPHIGHO2_02_FULL_47_11 TaxID=1802270 RepID=A0A1G2KLV1_9BACT|nr:MAG: hypothetical protein A3C07_01005 [Candidatus Sungbacteria bacterium RIFCSPHIGHO2_02_FULL_47_11]